MGDFQHTEHFVVRRKINSPLCTVVTSISLASDTPFQFGNIPEAADIYRALETSQEEGDLRKSPETLQATEQRHSENLTQRHKLRCPKRPYDNL